MKITGRVSICCLVVLWFVPVAGQSALGQTPLSGGNPQWQYDQAGYSGLPAPIVPVAATVDYSSYYCPTCPEGNSTPGVATIMPPGSHYHDWHGSIYRRLPNRDDEIFDSPLDQLFRNVARNSWFRTEYMLWDFDDPGNTLIGSQSTRSGDPRDQHLLQLLVPDPNDPNNTIPFDVGPGRVMDLGGIALRDINGIRGTLGIPLQGATLEANIFAFDKASDQTSAPELPSLLPPPNAEVIIIPFTVDGQPGLNAELFDESFVASFSSKLWGSEANFVFDAPSTRQGLQIRPLAGFRYLLLDERMLVQGQTTFLGLLPSVTEFIDSSTENHVYGPQIGVRAEFVHKWFSVGVEPKFMAGFNTYEDVVTTTRFFFPTDPTRSTRQSATRYSSIAQLGVFGRIHVNESISLHVGYDLMWISDVSRPDESVRYNFRSTPGGGLVNAIVVDPSFEDMLLQGLSVGGEIRFK